MNEELKAALEGMHKALEEKTGAKAEELEAGVKTLAEVIEAGSVEAAAAKAEISELKTAIEDLEAKQSAPFIHTDKKSEALELQSKEAAVFETFIKEGGEAAKVKAAGDDIQISEDAQGGFALPEELMRSILAVQHERSPMRQVCDVRTASTTDIKQLISIGDAASGWVGETDARTATTVPQLAQRTATFGEVYAMPRAYQHALDDAFFDVSGWLAEEVGRQFAEAEGTAYLTGDGTNKPTGILNGLTAGADAARDNSTGAFQVIDSGVSGALGATATDMVDFLRTIPSSLVSTVLPGCRWMMNRATHDVLAGLKDGDGNYYMQRDIKEGTDNRLLGYNIVINDEMDSLGAGAKLPIMFGDFQQSFQIIDRIGVRMLRDNLTSKGSVLFYTTKRVGSMVKNADRLAVVSVSA